MTCRICRDAVTSSEAFVVTPTNGDPPFMDSSSWGRVTLAATHVPDRWKGLEWTSP